MYTHHVTPLEQFSTLHITFAHNGNDLSYSQILTAWRGEPKFVDHFVRVLADTPFDGFLWETPPITAHTVDRPFEMVVIDSPALARMRGDPSSFRNELKAAARRNQRMATFANRGGDAVLVAPTWADPPADFAHLAAFVRTAAQSCKLALWRAVANAVEARLRDAPLWISTSGLGVPWLHVRLDSRPKYYQYAPYRYP